MSQITEKQLDFINVLLRDRDVPEAAREHLRKTLGGMDARKASEWIDALKILPRRLNMRGVRLAGAADSLVGLPKSYYAVPAAIANVAMTDRSVANDYLFVVVAEYQGVLYMREVTGSPGGFVRSRLSVRDVRALADVLRGDSLGYIRKFGELYSVCGKCAAALTDMKSRESGFGPECRKALGV